MDLIETDSSEMCQQVLKQAVLTAGGKAVVAMRMVLEKCHLQCCASFRRDLSLLSVPHVFFTVQVAHLHRCQNTQEAQTEYSLRQTIRQAAWPHLSSCSATSKVGQQYGDSFRSTNASRRDC